MSTQLNLFDPSFEGAGGKSDPQAISAAKLIRQPFKINWYQDAVRAKLPLVGCDWDKNGVHYTFDGEKVEHTDSLEELLDILSTPHLVVFESTLDSFKKGDRSRSIKLCAQRGHVLKSVSPRCTASGRRFLNKVKTDENDTRVIFWRVTNGAHLHSVDTNEIAKEKINPVRDPVTTQLDMWRETTIKTPRGAHVKINAIITRKVKRMLKEEKPFTQPQQEAFCAKSANSVATVPAVVLAATRSSGRKMCERLLGLHEHGFPSIFRSNLMRHALAKLHKEHENIDEYKRIRSEWRREIRWFISWCLLHKTELLKICNEFV